MTTKSVKTTVCAWEEHKYSSVEELVQLCLEQQKKSWIISRDEQIMKQTNEQENIYTGGYPPCLFLTSTIVEENDLLHWSRIDKWIFRLVNNEPKKLGYSDLVPIPINSYFRLDQQHIVLIEIKCRVLLCQYLLLLHTGKIISMNFHGWNFCDRKCSFLNRGWGITLDCWVFVY